MNSEFGYLPYVEKMFFESLSGLSLEEQNEKLKTELEVAFHEKSELLRHISFLNSQISKYSNLINI